MANPRQRRKAKSSTHKPISHSKRAKRLLKKMPAIRGPKALQDAWDPSKTVRQNYQALGLQHTLNPISSGGSEVGVRSAMDQINASSPHPTVQSSSSDHGLAGSEAPAASSGLRKGFGRIVRDSSGNVVRVELPSDEEEVSKRDVLKKQNGPNDDPLTTESELRIWAQTRSSSSDGSSTDNTVVKDLENVAASASMPVRHTSFGERLYLERLAKKYGDDLEKMARDRRLNPEQKTAGELKRAIAKAGGLGAVCG